MGCLWVDYGFPKTWFFQNMGFVWVLDGKNMGFYEKNMGFYGKNMGDPTFRSLKTHQKCHKTEKDRQKCFQSVQFVVENGGF